MYERFPGEGAQYNEPSAPLTAPQSVLRAVKVMYVGLAASLHRVRPELLRRVRARQPGAL